MEKERYRIQYSTREYPDPWEKCESFCTTGQFAKTGDETFVRHCGPTAVTNLVLTLLHAEERSDNPQEVFRQAARIGRKMLIYHNVDLFHRFGGTSDFLVRPYLYMSLKKYGLHARIGRHFLMSEENVKKAVSRGSLLYVEVHHHPRYKNHHLICYCAKELFLPDQQGQIGFYLKCADGWTGQAEWLSIEQMPFGSSFLEILPGARSET